MSKKTLYLSALVFAVVLVWFYVNTQYTLVFSSSLSDRDKQSIEKLNEVIKLTQNYYVDDVDWNKASTKAIEAMLQSLDPHSVYITPDEAEHNDENFEGQYQGIGIQYDVIDGYINVIAVMPGSPSEKEGLFAGDLIVEIEGESAYGISTSEVPRKLKGRKGTTVNIAVKRAGFDDLLSFEITRDKIPIFSINTSFMANDTTGYIWLSRFGSKTADELESALINLEKQGMKNLVLDLRNNTGGFLQQAVRVVGKFISGHKKVVYTHGRLPEFDEEHYSDDHGKSIDRAYPLIVLINQSSASASEIVAGALQDYDRALIAGTGSFGKGLVQSEFVLNDDSRLRLTISKYYTPSGRLIQKPYQNKSLLDYYDFNETESDTVSSVDTSKAEMFYTSAGRPVFGGGGIKPDVDIPYESYSKSPKLTQKLFEKRLFYEVASQYANAHKNLKNIFNNFMENQTIPGELLNQLKEKAAEKNITFSESDWNVDETYIKNRLKAELARSIWSQSEFWQVILMTDNQFKTALTLFDKINGLNQGMIAVTGKN